ncbi:MAG TPA: PAS domain S-box protein [Gemmatimonadales bacterium]
MFLRSVLESSTEYSIVAEDLEGTILVWNEGARRTYGYESSEIVGVMAQLLYDPDYDAARESREKRQQALDHGVWSGEVRRIRKDGSRFSAHMTLTLRREADGTPAGFTMIDRDLTAEQRLLSELHRSRQRFEHIVESAPDATVIVDHGGEIVLVNSQTERLFGYPRADLLGKRVEMLVPERLRGRHPGHRSGYFDDPRVRPMGASLELFGLRQDGSEFPVEISLSPLEVGGGLLVSSSIRDVTERKRLEEQLRRKNEELEEQARRVQEANRLKSEFLANMSHELRTPLNAVVGFAEIIHDGKAGSVNADQKEFLGDILTSSQHLLRLINDVLDLAKVEAGKMEFHPEPVEMASLVGEVRDVVRTMTAARRIALTIDIDPDLAGIEIDASKFKQVLYNYLSNALKFTPIGGAVTVRVRPNPNDTFLLEVTDSGIGIKPNDMERLFREFEQLDASASKEYSGTGLGLALTRRIVEAQGGNVSVESTLGMGSVFRASLPRRGAQRGRLINEETEPPDLLPRALVIEDREDDRAWLVRMLKAQGYHTEVARTGARALELLQGRQFDLVTLDLILPDIAGAELLRGLRAGGPNRDTPVLVVTVVPDAGFAKHLGAEVLLKPVSEDAFAAAVGRTRGSRPS